MELILTNLTAKAKKATWNGRDYLVAPLSLIVPGVLAGSQGPLFYPPEEVGRFPEMWNGMPITANHPLGDDGLPRSARLPAVLAKQGVGTVFEARHEGKLSAEGWFDVEQTKRVDNRIYDALAAGKKIELSTGLFTVNDPAPAGAVHNGKPYTHIARGYRPDHVAVLVDATGACSIADGCGVGVNEGEVNAKRFISPTIITRFVEWLTGNDAAVTPTPKPPDLVTPPATAAPPTKPTKNEGTPVAFDRKAIIADLVANCDCWKDGAETLNGLDDDRLKKLHAQQELLVKTLAANAAAAPPPGKQRVEAPAAAAPPPAPQQPLTAFDWLTANNAPADVRNAVANAIEADKLARAHLVAQLTANLAEGDQKKAMAAYLSAKPQDELRNLLLLVGPPPVNAPQQPAGNYYGAPTYRAAAGGAVNRPTDEVRKAILPLPTMNWNADDEEDERPQRRRQGRATPGATTAVP